MEEFNKKNHWENIYQTKELKDVSWYQPVPTSSMEFVKEHNIPLTAKIIDIGGGDSFFVDHLLALGYENISVLDISFSALEKAKIRLGEKASKVKWIVSDITTFETDEKYDFWHDRAAFHFLTNDEEIEKYKTKLTRFISDNGIVVIGTFSTEGPIKCSGIEIKQYSEELMETCFSGILNKIECKIVDHSTPFNTVQNFVFCSFTKRNL